jgi:hypothetical protein
MKQPGALLRTFGLLLFCAAIAPANMAITINPGAGLTSDALAAFTRAAHSWEALFTDPINIIISADLEVLANPNTIGSTSLSLVSRSYTEIRDAMATDAFGEPTQSIAEALPTAAQFLTAMPSGFTYSGDISVSRANAKALSLAGISLLTGVDGTITFNSTFNFDYDNSNGVEAGKMDFETVAAHEIGHVLGFFSRVDSITGSPTAVDVSSLDLFRFGAAPATLTDFSTAIRQLTPGQPAVFADTVYEYAFATGLSGDGHQASHWKADELSGTYIGMMDPTLATGQIQAITFADFRALDFIGYDQAIPEPATSALAALALLALAFVRKRLT